MAKRKRPNWVKENAKESLKKYLQLAEDNFKKNRKRSSRYIDLALKTAEKYNLRLPPGYRKKICRSCRSLLMPGINVTVRADPKTKFLVYTCKDCKRKLKLPYKHQNL